MSTNGNVQESPAHRVAWDGAFLVLDRDWHVTYANEPAENWIHRSREEFLNQVLWETLPTLRSTRFESECRSAIQEQTARVFEEFDPVTGECVETHLCPSQEGLEVHRFDITTRKLEQMALSHREEWFSTLVNSVGAILWVADPETLRFSFVSKQAEELLGYPVEQWSSEPEFWRNHTHPEDAERSITFCRDSTAHGRDHEFEYRMIAADGRVVWLRDIVKVVAGEGDKAAQLRGVMLDITERKAAEERLKVQEEHFRTLVNNAWDAILIVDHEGVLLYASPSFERMSGYKPDRLLGKSCHEWVHPEDAGQCSEFLQDVFRDGKAGLNLEFRSRHKDGGWRVLEANGNRITDESGQIVAVINIRDNTRRSFMEQKLRESEARFRLLFEKNAAGMAICGMDYRILNANPAICNMLGYTEEELRQINVKEVIHPDDLSETLRAYDEVKSGHRRAADLEKRYICKDGRIVWGHTTAIFLYSRGEPLCYVATVQDITERKAATEALKVSEERYRSLVLASTTVVWVTDAEGKSLPGQPSWRALTGQDDDESIGFGWLDAVHPEDRGRVQKTWAAAVEREVNYQTQMRIRTASGEYRDFTIRAVPVRATNGKVREWVGTCTDITKEKRAVADVVKWKTRYESAAWASGQVLFEWSLLDNSVTYRGDVEAILGYSQAELLGGLARAAELFHPEDRAAVQAELQRIRHHKKPFELVYRLSQKDGTCRVMCAKGMASAGDNGATTSMIGFISDITQRENLLRELSRAKEAAEAAGRAKDDFLAALSHELRTPLNPVLMLSSELERSPEVPTPLRKDFAMIRKNVELEARIIDDLLDLTRVIRGKLQLDIQTVDVHSLVHHALEFVREELAAKQLVLTLELFAPRFQVRGDPIRLQQVFWNVLKNAVKFTPSGGSIRIRSHESAGTLLLEFTDTGIGIADEDLPNIFDAFVQGRKPESYQFGGLGLGLTISKLLVEHHGGHIRAESDGRNRGATFIVELPLESPAPARPTEGMPQGEKQRVANRKGSRILLVEDDETTRATLARLLGRHGYQVTTADTLAAARELAAHHSFDLVTSDIGLPDGTGHELMTELKAKYGLSGIALSGYGMREDIQRSLASGFVSHLTKPVDIEALERAIDDASAAAHPVS